MPPNALRFLHRTLYSSVFGRENYVIFTVPSGALLFRPLLDPFDFLLNFGCCDRKDVLTNQKGF